LVFLLTTKNSETKSKMDYKFSFSIFYPQNVAHETPNMNPTLFEMFSTKIRETKLVTSLRIQI